MSIVVRVPIMDDVDTDEDLKTWIRQNKKLTSALSHHLSIAAGQLGAMLKPWDEAAKKRRRGKVTRPLVLAVIALLLVSRYLMLVQKRFEAEYAEEIEAARQARRRTRAGSRKMKFGG